MSFCSQLKWFCVYMIHMLIINLKNCSSYTSKKKHKEPEAHWNESVRERNRSSALMLFSLQLNDQIKSDLKSIGQIDPIYQK